MVTFTINIPQMLAYYTSTMDPMGFTLDHLDPKFGLLRSAQTDSADLPAQVANITDMIFSGGVVLFLVIAGPIVHFETEQDQRSYAAFISWSFCVLNKKEILELELDAHYSFTR